jgi:Protein of unknown function (DUF3558)
MGRVRSAGLVGSLLLVAACSGSATPSPSGGGGVPLVLPSSSPSASALESPSASASAPPSGGSAIPTSTDPCQLLTNDQAGQVNGETYGDGVGHTVKGVFKLCVWQNTSAHSSVTVELVVAPGVTQAEQDYAEAQALNHGFSVENLTDVGDAAAIARAPANIVKTGGIYVRKGVTFFDVVYLSGTVPTDDQLKATANIILPELP